MSLKGVGVVQVDGMSLMSIFSDVLQVVAKNIAKTTEFGFATICQTEFECLVGNRLVKNFQANIVSKSVENGTVCFPQELQPWGNNRTIGTVLALFTTNGAKHNGFWSFGSFQVVNGIQSDLICFGLSFCHLLLCQFQESVDDELVVDDKEISMDTM